MTAPNGYQPYGQQDYGQQQYSQNADYQYYQQQGGYQQQPYGYGGEPKWNGLAIAGFVCSFFISIVGLILSIIGLNQTKERGEKGHGLALAGIIISCVSIGLALVTMVAGLSMLGGMVGQLDDAAYYSGLILLQ